MLLKHSLVLLLVLAPAAFAADPVLPIFPAAQPPSHPALPREFPPFDPPAHGVVSHTSPIAAASVSAGPDQSVVLTGDFVHTQFRVFSQSTADNGRLSFGQIQCLNGNGAIVTLPAELPPNSMYLIWPIRGDQAGPPIAINRTDAKWLYPAAASPGGAVSIFGRNLTSGAAKAKAWVYLAGPARGQWLQAVADNPYKIDITFPADLPPGGYQVWAHNGVGGRCGFSDPLSLTIQRASEFSAAPINVKTFGASGGGKTDDGRAIQSAISSAKENVTVYFPEGDYRIGDEQLILHSNLQLRGDGAEKTRIHFTGQVTELAKQLKSAVYSLTLPDHSRHVRIAGMSLIYDGPAVPHGVFFLQRYCSDVSYDDVTLLSRCLIALDALGSDNLNLAHCRCAGAGFSLLNTHDVRIDQTQFQEAFQPDAAIDVWNAHNIAITGCTFQNLDPAGADPSGWGLGRVLEDNCIWGSIYNQYIAGNTSINLGALHAGNTGEHINLEGAVEAYKGPPISADAATLTIPITDRHEGFVAIVTDGPGIGQMRTILSFTPQAGGTKLALDRPWTIIPDSTSRVEICTTVHDSVFYGNNFRCRLNSQTANNLQAAAGFEVWDGGYGLVCDSNTFDGMNHGVVIAAYANENPCYFIDVLNNHLLHSRAGGLECWPEAHSPRRNDIGVVFRGNRIDTADEAGIVLCTPDIRGAAAVTLMDIEHNTVVNVPTGMRVWADRDCLAYRNTFDAGAAASAESAAVSYGSTLSAILLHDNAYLHFARNFFTARR